MVISANRMSTMNGNYVIAANESYSVDDMGRILIENEMNDMAIFNAMLKSDMCELQARTEGTLLESEIQSMNEASIRDLFDSIAAKIKKAWAKIKGWFQSAYSMVTAYCVRNGKAFIAANRKALSELNDSTKVEGTYYSANRFEETVKFGTAKNIANIVGFDPEKSASKSDITKSVLSHYLGKSFADSDKSPYEFLKDKKFEKVVNGTVSSYGGKAKLMSDIENGMSSVKKLKETEKKLEAEVKNILKELQQKAKSEASDLKGKKADEKSKEADFYRIASTAVTNGMASYTKAIIKCVKFRLAQERIVLAKAIGKQARTEATLLESMILEIKEEAEELGADTVDPSDVDLEEIKNAVVDAVEEVLDQESDDDIGGSDEDDYE